MKLQFRSNIFKVWNGISILIISGFDLKKNFETEPSLGMGLKNSLLRTTAPACESRKFAKGQLQESMLTRRYITKRDRNKSFLCHRRPFFVIYKKNKYYRSKIPKIYSQYSPIPSKFIRAQEPHNEDRVYRGGYS